MKKTRVMENPGSIKNCAQLLPASALLSFLGQGHKSGTSVLVDGATGVAPVMQMRANTRKAAANIFPAPIFNSAANPGFFSLFLFLPETAKEGGERPSRSADKGRLSASRTRISPDPTSQDPHLQSRQMTFFVPFSEPETCFNAARDIALYRLSYRAPGEHELFLSRGERGEGLSESDKSTNDNCMTKGKLLSRRQIYFPAGLFAFFPHLHKCYFVWNLFKRNYWFQPFIHLFFKLHFSQMKQVSKYQEMLIIPAS